MDYVQRAWKFATEYLSFLEATCHRAARGVKDTTEEILSQVLARLPDMAANYDCDKGDWIGYMIQTVRWWVFRLTRRLGSEATSHEPLHLVREPVSRAPTHIEAIGARDLWRAIASRLTEWERNCLYLHAVDELSDTEIGRRLGASRHKVSSTIEYAIIKAKIISRRLR